MFESGKRQSKNYCLIPSRAPLQSGLIRQWLEWPIIYFCVQPKYICNGATALKRGYSLGAECMSGDDQATHPSSHRCVKTPQRNEPPQ